MNFFRKLFGLFFLGFILLGILGVFGRGGHGRYQSTYQQGFLDGQQVAAAQSAADPETAAGAPVPVPNQRPGADIYFRGHGFYFPGFGLLFCLIPFFFMGLFFMVFGKRRWHRHHHHRGGWGHRRGGRPPWKGGPCGPRRESPDSPQEKSPDDIDDGPDEPIMRA